MTNMKFARLYRLMCQIRDLLLNAKKWEWAAWMDRGVALMEQREPDSIELFLAAFGGVDGIDHYVIVPMKGYELTVDALGDMNSALAVLLVEAHDVASQLRQMIAELSAVGDREEPQSVDVRASL